jgi:hypothetical protein
MVVLGTSQGYFAAIKGYITNGTTNTIGKLVFATRKTITDGTLTNALVIDEAQRSLFGYTADQGGGQTVQINGNVYTSGALNIGSSAVIGGNPVLVVGSGTGGDILLNGADRAIGGNLYYNSGWKYAANGTGAAIISGVNSTIPLQVMIAGNNSSGAAAAATTITAIQSDVSGNMSFIGQVSAAGGHMSTGAVPAAVANAVALDYSGGNLRLMSFGATSSTFNPVLAVQKSSDGSQQRIVSLMDANGNTDVASLGVSGFIYKSVNSALAAAGTTQGTATSITTEVSVVTTGTGGVLLQNGTGVSYIIINATGSSINVYPASGAQIDGLGTNVGYSLPAGGKIMYICTGSTQYYTLNATFG